MADPVGEEARMFARINALLTRSSDILLAVGVVLILGTLVVRVPPAVMDYLIATNISISAAVLLVALYVPEAAKVPSFPTILLLTTLFRLALNVSTTRLILLEANAGEIIFTFGNFVVGGNYVVGGVVFVVIVIVQFIVIAKGSERVAEVAARFTLDAMPGKQMSIDADIRSGLLSPDEGRARRQELERESKLYGAMDGAMKFVKGDAIAGIIIALVNIIGGLVIGVMQQGMGARETAEIYSLLTIGDGLVSQIPALLVSVSAGLVVTRVAATSDASGSRVAGDIADQFLGQPRAIVIVGVLLLTLAVTSPWTGFPWAPFVVLAVLAFVASLPRLRAPAPEAPAPARAAGAAPAQEQTQAPRPSRPPLVLEIHPSLEPLLLPADPGARERLTRMLVEERMDAGADLGVKFPGVAFRINRRTLPPDGYAVVVNDGPVAAGAIPPDRVLALCGPSHAKALGVEVTAAPLPWGRVVACLAPAGGAERLRERGVSVLPPERVIMRHLRVALRRNAAEFLGIQEVRTALDALDETHPALVKAVTPVPLSLQQVAEVLQRLLREQVPVANLPAVLEAMARHAPAIKSPVLLAERVRGGLSRMICARGSEGVRRLRYYTVDPEIEDMIGESTVETADGPVVAMSYADQTRIVRAFERAIDPARHVSADPVVVVSARVRRLLKVVLGDALPEVSVLSFDELCPDFALEAISLVSLAEVAEEAAATPEGP